MNNIYINTFEQAKLDFVEFVKDLFMINVTLNSFTISLKTKRIVLHGKEINQEHILSVSNLSFFKKKDIEYYCEKVTYNGILIEKHIPSNFFTAYINPIIFKNTKRHTHIIEQIESQKLFLLSTDLFISDKQTSCNFFRDNIEHYLQEFIGIELYKKLQVIDLIQKLDRPILYDELKSKV
jgi:hypothetical protein